MTPSLLRRATPGSVLIGMGLCACAGAPVQEMSNARQAIKAARDAGADKTAPQTLNEAQASA